MKALMRLGLVVFLSVFILQMLGCARIKETTKCFFGISTRSLEKARKDAVSKMFDYDYFTAYTKALDALGGMKAYIYAKNIKKHMIAIYVSEEDTTPVGIFFKEAGKDITQIEVSSPSSYARDAISAKLFAALAPKPAAAKTTAEKPEETEEK